MACLQPHPDEVSPSLAGLAVDTDSRASRATRSFPRVIQGEKDTCKFPPLLNHSSVVLSFCCPETSHVLHRLAGAVFVFLDRLG